MDVNFFGAVALTKAFLPLIRASKGRIINMSSLYGVLAGPAVSAYCASKFALEGFSDSLRKELLPLGVSVSLINPAMVITPIVGKTFDLLGQDRSEEVDLLYGTDAFFAKFAPVLAHAETTAVTDAATIQACFSPRPSARYFVSNFAGTPAVVLAFLARVLPTNLFDLMVLYG